MLRRTASFVAAFGMLAATLAVLPGQAANAQSESAPIANSVSKRLDEKGTSDYWVVLDEQADLGPAKSAKNWREKGQLVVDELKATAKKTQGRTKKLLKDRQVDFTSYWISNRILVHDGDTKVTNRLAELPEVARIAPTRELEYNPPKKGKLHEAIQNVEWNISRIRADAVWEQFGIRGEGIVVGNTDTGVQFDHPALVDSYRGNLGNDEFDHNYNWFDPSQVCDTADPCDWSGHGSHTMGTMLGDDGGDNQVGVAPEATWIAAMGCDLPPNGCSDAALLASGQWMLAPTDLNGENPRVDKRPHIVNNSWGGANGGAVDPWYDEVLQAWDAAGIFGVWSNGNSGPSCDTTGSPADSPHAYSVGSFTESGAISGTSSRGPGADGEVRPNLAAPGAGVRSSVPENDYAVYSGTSMAAPHVSGTVALLWSAAPALIGDIEGTREVLNRTAVDTDDTSCGGTAENNNVWGEGKLDALAAVEAAPRGDTGTLTGQVSGDGEPLAGATVTTSGEGSERRAVTDENGEYELLLPVGEHEVRVTAFGYVSAREVVMIREDETKGLSIDLSAAPSHAVQGTVLDEAGDPVANATVGIADTPLNTETDADGAFAFEAVPEGTYRITADGNACLESGAADLVVEGPQQVELELAHRSDDYGHVCAVATSEYVEGDTELDLSGDDSSASLNLPFDLWLYGEPYGEAYVSTNGHLNFEGSNTDYANEAIPDPAPPNAAVYPFWDDLAMDAESSAHTAVTGEAPNRTFVVEWRNATFYDGSGRIDFEVQFSEQGEITFAYRNLDETDPAQRGGQATIGIENADGTDALSYSVNEPTLNAAEAIRFTPPPSGFVTGKVVDANDGDPVGNIEVTANDGDQPVATATTGTDGGYGLPVPAGDYELTAGSDRYQAASEQVTVTNQEIVEADFTLKTGVAELDAPDLEWLLAPGTSATETVTLTNTGSAPLRWETAETGGSPMRTDVSVTEKAAEKAAESRPDARTARNRYTDEQEREAKRAAKRQPLAEGEVLAKFETGLNPAWGVGFDSDVWISDPEAVTNTEFTTDGEPTGMAHDASWAGEWNGDMAYDTRRDAMCQVNVGGDNGIYCWNPQNGEVRYSLTGSPWSGISQRGLAYREDQDTFYVGGWNENVVYRVAGRSADEPGATLDRCQLPVDDGLAGLAYNSTADVLWVTTNSPTNPILRLDPSSCEVLGELGFPENAEYAGAGLGLDHVGNLWATSQVSGTAYLIDSGVPKDNEVEWLSQSPSEGELAPGESVEVEIEVDGSAVEAGHYRAGVLFRTNAGRQATLEAPVELKASAYWTGVDVGSEKSTTDAAGYDWVADQEYEPGSYGWKSEYNTVVRSRPKLQILGTQDDRLYTDFRARIQSYAFDDLPAGTYRVTLDFAELQRSPRVDWRKFDVDINGDWVLVGHDIAREVGGRHADRHTFTVKIDSDGDDLAINFHKRRGHVHPMVNAVRVVHRPDLG